MRVIFIALTITIAVAVIAQADESTTIKGLNIESVTLATDRYVPGENDAAGSAGQYKRIFDDEPFSDLSSAVDREPNRFSERIREAVKKYSSLFTSRPTPRPTTKAPEPMD